MSDIGHLGELKAMNLLRKKLSMDIYFPLADKGIDFIAVKEDKFFQVQVKTSMFQKNSYFWFDLYKRKMVYSRNTVYIFVCTTLSRRLFMGKAENYLIVPSLELHRWIGNGDIVSKKGNDNCFNLFLYPDKEHKQWLYRNTGHSLDWTVYWNNLGPLE